MTTISSPALGVGGFPIDKWAEFHDSEDGIRNDYTATGAFALSRISAGNIARIVTSAALACINGYGLKVTADEDLVVSTTAGTYYIAVQYAPTLNVADGSGNAVPAGPCRLVINTTLPTGSSEVYLLLYSITRTTGQALTAATVVDYRRWYGPTISLPDYPSSTPAGFGPFPRGTRLIQTDIGVESVRVPNAGGSALVWQNLDQDTAIAFPFASGLVSHDASPSTPQMVKFARGQMVQLRGTLKRSSGNLSTGSPVKLGTLPVGSRPLFDQRFMCFINGSPGYQAAYVRAEPGGDVWMDDPPNVCTWIDLSGVIFRAEN